MNIFSICKRLRYFCLLSMLMVLEACGGGSEPNASSNFVTTANPTAVVARNLEQIVISPFSDIFPVGNQVVLSSTGIYSDQSHEDVSNKVKWSVDDQTSALIDSSGNLTLLDSGSITVTAAFLGTSAQKEITISAAILDSIDIVPQRLNIASGLQQNYQALGNYSDGSSHDISHQVEWQSDNTHLIEFSAAVATSKSAGSTIVSATLGQINAQATATVSSAILQRIEFATRNPVLEVGYRASIQVVGIYSDDSIRNITDQVIWSVDDSSVAIFNENTSTLSGITAGAVHLTASFNGFSIRQTVNVSQANLVQIEISPERTSIAAGHELSFQATAIFSNQTSRDITPLVTWKSSDPTVAAIDNRPDYNGNTLSYKPGITTITATFAEQSSEVVLTVTDAELTNIEVSPATISLAKGTQHNFVATAFFSDGSQKRVTDVVTWSSTSPIATTVSGQNTGQFQTNDTGTALVIASLDQKQGYAQIEVSSATLDSLTIVAEASNQASGTTQSLTLFGQYSDGSILDLTQQAIWTSASPGVAVVDNATGHRGVLTTISEGVTNILAQIGSQQKSLTVNVSAAILQRIELSGSTQTLLVNQSSEIQATGYYSDLSQQDLTGEVFWTSTNSNIASVSNTAKNSGLLTPIASGTTIIQASFSGVQSPSLIFNVIDNPNFPASIGIHASPNVIFNDGIDSTTVQVKVKPLQAQGVIADGTDISFVILENQVTRVVNGKTLNGVASFNLTSTTSGFIIITAEIDNTELNATTAVLSTGNFLDVFQIVPVARVKLNVDKTIFEKDSVFALFIRNLSNRSFNLLSFQMKNGTSALPGLPVNDVQYLSDGILEGSEYTGLGYSLDYDTINNTINSGYILSDDSTQKVFGFTIAYNF